MKVSYEEQLDWTLDDIPDEIFDVSIPLLQRTRGGVRNNLERSSRERESHLLNPPPGSTDPERFATVSIS